MTADYYVVVTNTIKGENVGIDTASVTSKTVKVTAKEPTTGSSGITFTGSATISIKKGAQLNLKSMINNPDGILLIYKSSNETITTVDENGIVRGGSKAGKATISVYTYDNLTKPAITVSVTIA